MRNRLLAYVLIGSLSTAVDARAGTLWEPLGDGPGDPDNQWVNSLVVWNGQLIATMNGTPGLDDIAAWDGSQWNRLGDGLDGSSYETTHGNQLVIDGALLGSGRELLAWDGSTWTGLLPVSFDPGGYGNALVSFQGTLFEGDSHYSLSTNSYWGRLWSLGGSGWEHEEWFEASSSFGGINLVTVLGDKLYVHVYSNSAALHVYDGTSWSEHSTTHLVRARDLLLVNDNLYLGGVDLVGNSYVLKWDGAAWISVLAETCAPPCLFFQSYGSMAEWDSKVAVSGYVGAAFGVAAWNGSSWTRLDGEMDDAIRAMAVYDGHLITAGSFTEIDGVPMPRIARYVGPTTPVAIAGLRVQRQRGGVRLEWEITADEVFEGFHVHRRIGEGTEVRVNSDLLPVDTRSFVDAGVMPGASYSYVLVAVGAASGEVRSQRISVHIPALAAALEQNVPNPFNPSTTIGFTVPEHSDVRIDVFDGSGARVVTLVDGPYGPGEWTVEWDGTGASGSRVASGVYYYRMRMGNESFSKKMVLLK